MRDRSPLGRLWRYAGGHRRRVYTAGSFSVLNKLFDLAPPVLIGMAVDVAVRQEGSWLAQFGIDEPRDQLLVLAVVTFLIWGLESLFEYLHSIWWRNLAQTLQDELRVDAYGHIQQLDMEYFEDRRSGDLMAALNDDVNQLERFLDQGANDILQVLTTVVAIGIAFFVIAPSVAWMSFLPIPVIVWGSFRFQRALEPRYALVRAQAAEVNAQLANNLGGMATIKSFTAETVEVERVSVESARYRTVNAAAIRLSSAFSPLIRVVILTGFTATLIFGGFLTLDGRLEVGAYSVMVFLTQRLLWPLTRLGQTFDLYQRAMASTNRVLDIVDTEPLIVDGAHPLPLEEVKGEVALAGVSFAYANEVPVLRQLSLTAQAGLTTAIVGATGSGKTTVVKLLLRFYDPQHGRVLLDGHDVRELRLADVRSAVGLVSQDVYLFHGTIGENIEYGRPGASRADIVSAATVAEVHEFVATLPDGYDTVVGERGIKLSGGQRQRISIARAVLKDPPVLVLDEATSSVDNETEAAIQRSLEKISIGRTTIVIAHRLSTIRHADAIYVLSAGEVAEFGTHDELIERDGLYAALWHVQTGEAVAWHEG